MKKVINGKLYNTETAQKIYETDNGLGMSDHRFFNESLYRKRTGEFFLAGKGGGMTKYARCYGGACGFGEDIFPLTPEETKAWVEKHMEADDYEKLFGPCEE